MSLVKNAVLAHVFCERKAFTEFKTLKFIIQRR